MNKCGLFTWFSLGAFLHKNNHLNVVMTEARGVVINCKKLKIGTAAVGP